MLAGSFFTPPTDNAAPQDATGGAARGVYDENNEVSVATSGAARSNIYGVIEAASTASASASMLAVMPESFYGTTLEARPTILVYVPPSSADTAVFSLKTESKETAYQSVISVPKAGGVIAIELPPEAPELALNANYQWYLALQFERELTPGSPFVDGWIKRIEPTQELALAQAQGVSLSAVETLGASGIWYDTAARLASLTETQADETISGHWVELLESVGLSDIATAPIVM
ncbi:MAG: DUF928 domain-containing protein [Cyanobacteria bacterium P01_D01_bin.105]